MAAGFTAKQDMLEKLKFFLNNEFRDAMTDSEAHLHEQYTLDLTSSAVNLELISEINILEPFGNGNPAPIFRFSNLYVLKADIVGGKHIRIIFAPRKDSYGSKTIAAIAFNAVGTELEKIILSPKPYNLSVLGSLKINSWQGSETVQLQLKDVIIDN